MDNREFFNELAFKWDEMCNHDDEKIKKIIELSSIRGGSNILDVGTGTGILISYLLKENPYSITAVDISENMIAVAKEKFKDNRVKFMVKNIMEFNEKGFDYIFLYSVYPHFDNKEELFKHLFGLLNPEGRIVIAHSESREKINNVHAKSSVVRNDVLPKAEITVGIMEPYFSIDKVIDSEDMYYISGTKK